MTPKLSCTDIKSAATRLAGYVLDTPRVESKTLDQIVG